MMDSGDPEVRNDLPLVEALKAYDALPMSEKTTITHQSPAYCYAKGWIAALNVAQAAHRAEVERAVREAVEQERAACAFASIDVIRAVMRELDEFSKGEVAENGYIDEGDDDGTGHTPFRNGWTLYGFARNEMCGVLTKVPAAIRARGAKS